MDLQVSAILAASTRGSRPTPRFARIRPIKNILMQVQRYNKENQKMRELLPDDQAGDAHVVPRQFHPDLRRRSSGASAATTRRSCRRRPRRESRQQEFSLASCP